MAQLGAAPEQLAAMTGPLQQMMRSIGGAMFGTQIGQALGELAGEVVGSTDVGLPLAPEGTAALLPANVTAFGEGLEVPADQVRLYLALREAAHHRLFAHVPWLRAHLLDAVEAYARGITRRHARLEEAMGDDRPDRPRVAAAGAHRRHVRARGHARAEGRAGPARDGARPGRGLGRRGRRRRGRRRLPAAGALRETVRRRRASGGPAEQTFATLVGLELRPRRLREAAALWRPCSPSPRQGRPGRGLGAPRPAADRRGPRRPGRLRRAAARRRWTCPACDDTEAPPEPPAAGRPARRDPDDVRRRDRCTPAQCCPRWTPDAAGRAAHGVRRPPRGPRGRDLEGLRARRTSRRAPWCSTPTAGGCC